MSSNSDHETVEESIVNARLTERRRIVGILLNAYGIYQLSGQESIAHALDALVTTIENPEREA